MRTFFATNPDHALANVLAHINMHSPAPSFSLLSESDSRNGRVLRFVEPVTTIWPEGRCPVSYWSVRDANPFFHLMEALWMLAGRNDLAFLTPYAKNMAQFSDDGGVTQPAAYGHRWRRHFASDQLLDAIDELKYNPTSRRVVLAMWDVDTDDFKSSSTDLPCNTHVYFDRQGNDLHMTVCCRSNDIVWGAYGSNAVHFTLLQEFVAAATGCRMGTMYQMSNNLHFYRDRPDCARLLGKNVEFLGRQLLHVPVLEQTDCVVFLQDLELRLGNLLDAQSYFLANVAGPMQMAHDVHKDGFTEEAIAYLRRAPQASSEWLVAGALWLERRLAAQREKPNAV